MDGYTLTKMLESAIQEDLDTSDFIDQKTIYDYLFLAAVEYARRTQAVTDTEALTTVADQEDYDLPGDFLLVSLVDDEMDQVIKYSDGTSTYFLKYRDYGSVLLSNNTDSVSIPSNFSLTDKAQGSNVTGTATSDGSASQGECTLTDTSGLFTTTDDVSAGDLVHNTTDGSYGVVVSVTDATHLVTALFGGTNNDWTSADAYIIIPQARTTLILDPPPSTAAHTATVYYVKRPTPVYSSYRSYPFPNHHSQGLVNYAAWLYKYKDRQPVMGDVLYKSFEIMARNAVLDHRRSRDKFSFRVNMRKQSFRDRSYR